MCKVRMSGVKLASILPILLFLLHALPGTAQTATIYRDAWGAPHVFSETDAGALYGSAWALAEDDWTLIEENYLHALGRYAELVGQAGVADDWMARNLEIVPLSIREYNASSPRMRRLLDAYAAGLNAWLATQPASRHRVLRRIEPWYPLALLRYKYYQNEYLGYAGLRGGWAQRLMNEGLPAPKAPGTPSDAAVRNRIGGASPHQTASPPPAAALPVDPMTARYYEAQFDALGFRPRGSNQWALAAGRTAAGHPMLLINPHQTFVGVQRYAEIHVDSREGLRFAGLTVFGFLLPYMGHNDRLGWAYTDNYADHSDLYAENFDDARNPLSYRYGDTHRTAVTWTDSIRVRTDTGFTTRTFRFWKTHHGPIVGVTDDGRPVAAKLSRMTEGGWFEQWDEMIRARTLADWKKAVSQLRVAYMNTMYADADGNIGYIYNSAVPIRNPGINPAGVIDGSDPRTEWQGFHTLEELPQVFNPASGWLLNTNSSPFTATRDLPFKRADFPSYMVGTETDNPRARSSRRILENMNHATFDEFATRAWDTRLIVADSLVPALSAEFARMTPQDPKLEPVIRRLDAWNRTADAASVETTWFVLMYEQMLLRRGRANSVAPMVDALSAALGLLQTQYGNTDVAWGEVNRHQRPLPGRPAVYDASRPSVGVSGAPGELGSVFTFYNARLGTAAPRVGLGGNSFVMAMEFAPVVRARSILNYGQSGDPASKHFFDQASLYARGQMKPAWFTRDEVVANASRSYTVGKR